jgi:hypothetical protein
MGHGGWPQLAKNSVMAMAVSHDVLYCASADMAIRAWVGILFLPLPCEAAGMGSCGARHVHATGPLLRTALQTAARADAVFLMRSNERKPGHAKAT